MVCIPIPAKSGSKVPSGAIKGPEKIPGCEAVYVVSPWNWQISAGPEMVLDCHSMKSKDSVSVSSKVPDEMHALADAALSDISP